MEFDDLLAQAEALPPATKTVHVCLNPQIAEQRAVLLQDLEIAQREDRLAQTQEQRLATVPEAVTERTDAAEAALAAFDEKVRESLVELRFTPLDGQIWAVLTAMYPMRVDVPIDRQYGYNVDLVTESAARRTGVRVDDDGEHPISSDQWDRMYRLMVGRDVNAIREAIFELNEYDAEKHIEALVKGYGAA